MTKIIDSADVTAFFEKVSGFDQAQGDARVKSIIFRLVKDIARVIEDLDITENELWKAVDYLNRLGARGEAGLLAAGLGIEHFMDLVQDAKDQAQGLVGGTPRTIEGPLYVAGAPLSDGFARMDDGTDNGMVMLLEGRVVDSNNAPVAGAVVDLWHANTQGNYSYFDSTQSEYNLRRRIVTDAQGYYRARTIVPSGYGCDPQGPTQECLNLLGRHGQRPAHVHFFISAKGYRHLTTQINFAGDEYLWDDFAYATRDGLVGELNVVEDSAKACELGIESERFATMEFNFALQSAPNVEAELRSARPRALQGA